jgi:shikimate kinase
MENMNLFLIGYRCTGKSTVGKRLADHLGWSFVDTDRLVVEKTGRSIFRMVDENGWLYFREQERKALESVSCTDRQVVATGGGIILDERNITSMKQSGVVIWLKASERTIETRMVSDDTTIDSRPSLTGEGLIAEITTVLAERHPFYEKAADWSMDTDHERIWTICERIIEITGTLKL